MQMFAQYALPATIVASAVGAVALCVVLVAFGFASEPDVEARSPVRRLFFIRLGHAIAAACFAAALMFGSLALLDQRRVLAPTPSATAPIEDVRRLESLMGTLAQRLMNAELQLADITHQRTVAESRPTAELPTSGGSRPLATARPRKSPPPPAVRRESPATAPATNGIESASPPRDRGETSTSMPLVVDRSATTVSASPPSDDFGTRVRADWQTVKRGFQDAGRELREGFADFGRRMKDTFSSN